MNNINQLLIEHKDMIFFSLDILTLLILGFIAYRIISRLYERDFTYKELYSIHNGLRFSDMMSMNEKKKSKTLYDRFNLLQKITDKAKAKFLLLDEERMVYINTYLIMRYVVPVVILLLSFMQGIAFLGRAVIAIPIILILPEIYIYFKRKEHVKSFENYSYKIFKFINNQRSAGVPTQKIITKLHLVVKDKKLERRLISFAADYIANNDYSSAFKKHITKYYSTGDALAVDNALSIGLNVGDRYALSDESESLMFDKYLAYIDYETEKQKLKSVFVAALFALVLIGLVGFPLVLDMIKSVEIIFG